MAAWSSREYDKPMEASLRMIASAIGIGPGGISSEMVDQMKRSVASSDCDGSNIVEVLERMAEDSDEEEHLGPLHDAASAGKMDVCKHLVENLEFDVDVRANDGSGKTPLTCAVSRGKVIAVRYLIAKGADLNKQDAMAFTPLHYAVKRGYSGIARLLLSRGANVDVESSEGTPLHVSAARGKFSVMEILLEHHADPDRVSPDLYTPLAKILCATYEKASVSACLKCMKLLVKAGADLNSTNPDTPLVIATSRGLNECVDYLLEVGADANIQIKHGRKTPIEIAAKSGRRNLVESLFPFTSPIQTISDWSVEGILAYARSRQSKHKGQKSDNDSKNQLNLNGERSVKEDAGASKGCTEDKLSDEDRKAQLKLHGGQAVKGKDYAGASKFYTEAIMLDPADATLYSNRSFCHLKIGGARDALVDANACISLQPDWPKGYYRKGAALMSLKSPLSRKPKSSSRSPEKSDRQWVPDQTEEFTSLSQSSCQSKTIAYWRDRLKSWGYDPLFLSVDKQSGFTALEEMLGGQTTVVVGPSGVGKSSLINALRGNQDISEEDPIHKLVEQNSKWFGEQRVGTVSKKSGKGKHTTRHVSLLPIAGGGFLADTPGFNQPSLMKVTKKSLAETFPEIRKALKENEPTKCLFNDCVHLGEHGCVVKGEWERYPYYLQMLDEIKIREEIQLRTFGTKREGDVRYKTGVMGVKQAEPRLELKKHRRVSRKKINQSILDEIEDDIDDLDDDSRFDVKQRTRKR